MAELPGARALSSEMGDVRQPTHGDDEGMALRYAMKARAGLGAVEGCDRCGLRARVLVQLGNGRDLYLCREHAREHGNALKRIARLTDLPD